MVLLRRELGDVLREKRTGQGRTLREVSASASVSLGYLSEVERGEKEASSELLASICKALELPLGQMLSDVADRVMLAEAAQDPVTAMLADGLAKPIDPRLLKRNQNLATSSL
ncbi:helix-turn-helix domain-containing protein [Ornithinimicrobium sp. Arc0846-15]|uniref:helix-turn-helix domain-containing protein n=1 Tax=Ornithinimicrobium sp. INDO-MA30-4 TaxID=2908651 RepID=UPI001C6652B9|nr:helix-turn-helix domain-containing protein [Ornithinimicrobium sp. INDO-MA30-4]MBW8171710.1 helix-turn-helix domain-containing protein [Ornithinimicrobium laminariae]UJH70744.1 helix-turn-helix domain-containing protein [Ornithinimicrobium sp. INDO-MA30-4]